MSVVFLVPQSVMSHLAPVPVLSVPSVQYLVWVSVSVVYFLFFYFDSSALCSASVSCLFCVISTSCVSLLSPVSSLLSLVF